MAVIPTDELRGLEETAHLLRHRFPGRVPDDLRHWVDIDRRVALRVLDLVEAVTRDPFGGIGTPELL